ncbi:MAG: biopolymer transporter ExbD, partial [Planctomycetes bacterium]|nr:biopolymer transporter ExbD [Planctomycetota bacterium]
MAKRSHLKDVQEDANMDMTPMIDVVFLLIIFFLCIEFKTLEAKLPAYLPKDRGSQKTPEEPVEQLSIKIVNTKWGTEIVRKPLERGNPYKADGTKKAFMLEGHVCHWEVGPKRYDDMEELRSALKKI